jgi:hypothetical protein
LAPYQQIRGFLATSLNAADMPQGSPGDSMTVASYPSVRLVNGRSCPYLRWRLFVREAGGFEVASLPKRVNTALSAVPNIRATQ